MWKNLSFSYKVYVCILILAEQKLFTGIIALRMQVLIDAVSVFTLQKICVKSANAWYLGWSPLLNQVVHRGYSRHWYI